jgi:hypothetical protein
MASTSLTRTFTTDNSNVYKWTYSVWVKRSGLGADQAITAPTASGTIQGRILFRSDDQLEVFDYRNGFILQKKTNRKFRDTSAWYHIVVSNDNSVSSPDTKIYINGVEETSFAIDNEYPQNETTTFNSNIANYIGTYSVGDYFSGSMSHFHFIDGTAYDATAFGEYDANGVWKIKTSPSVTYGTNGFFILKDGNSVTDQSGNSNNFTVAGGTLTNTEDNPSNVFATLNPLSQGVAATSRTFSNGNTSVTLGGADDSSLSSIGVSSGKWYAEFKITNDSAVPTVGVGNESSNLVTNPGACNIGSSTGAYGYFNNGQKRINGASLASYGDSFTTNDIIGIALDLTNGAIWFSKNGTWQASATISEIEAGTTTNAAATSLSGTFFFGCSNSASGTTGDAFSVNFGNGYFGTTAVSSAGTNASGNGIFEYDVPTGYTALSTKGLNL